jgi:hypothetical protein
MGTRRISANITETFVLSNKKPSFSLDGSPNLIVAPAVHMLIQNGMCRVSFIYKNCFSRGYDVFVQLDIQDLRPEAKGRNVSSRATSALKAIAARIWSADKVG